MFLALAGYALSAGILPLALLAVVGGLVVTALALRVSKRLTVQTESALVRQSQIEQLHAQMDGQRSSIDALADGLDVAVFICDGKANIKYANRRATGLFDFESPQGRSILAVTLSHDLEQLVLQSARLRERQRAELAFRYPEERVGIAQTWLGESDRVFLSIYDISELRRLERIRQDFVANVSHELRTPLTLIRAMAETLQDEPEPKTLERYLAKIIEEVDRLSLISQDLLILSAAESNPVRKQSCDLAEVCRGISGQLERRATDKGLAVRFVGPDHLVIDANSAQMSQVALNLIENAINYTSAGEVEIRVSKDGEDAVLEVEDTGLGIASEHLGRIFERFYRVDRARSRTTGGTGLGLSIVKHIVEAHGGTVSVASNLNQGTTFTVRLPA